MTPMELRRIIVEEIGNIAPDVDAASVDDAADLREALDLDSMDIFNLVVALSKRLEVEIPDADVGQLVTIGGATSYLARVLPRPSGQRA